MQVIDQALADTLIQLTLAASEAILAVYNDSANCEVTMKSDQSPVTAADLAAHQVIVTGLAEITPDIPVLSEESAIPDAETRKSWSRYWLIDPLDGTKEFIQRNGEFTVNIALIDEGKPILGVVTVPVTGLSYWGGKDLGAFKVEKGMSRPLIVRSMAARVTATTPVEIVASRRHGSEAMAQLEAILNQQFEHIDYKSMGSSLKLCLIAEGKADLYPRLAPTSEWDTAAAQAIVEAAGGVVVDWNFKPLIYNAKESLLNPFFCVIADRSYPWESLLKSFKVWPNAGE